VSQPPRFNREPPPPAIVYNTSMTTPDAALALGALWAAERQRRARVAGVCVTGGGFKAAVYCDLVNQFYRPGLRHGNDALAVGLADINALPADAPMVSVPVDRRDSAGQPVYARTIELPTDTSLAESQLRNAITFNRENSVILSAPATSLARSLQIANNRDLYTEPVQRLVLVESPALAADPEALAYLRANWPTGIVTLGAGLAANLSLPSAELEAAFAWADPHPVVDAVRAYRSTPYAVPVLDLLAMVYALTPDSEHFGLAAADGGYRLQLTAAAGDSLHGSLLAAAAANPG
jgi:hypothetical protein